MLREFTAQVASGTHLPRPLEQLGRLPPHQGLKRVVRQGFHFTFHGIALIVWFLGWLLRGCARRAGIFILVSSQI